MPLEGHWRRVNTPLRRVTTRERNVAIAVVAVTLVALAILILATAGDSRPAPARGCIRVVVAGRTGGEIVAGCGAEARATCARSATFDDPRAQKIVESCRRAGIGS
jgi:ABC-type hemin transport system substrate-binding protein